MPLTRLDDPYTYVHPVSLAVLEVIRKESLQVLQERNLGQGPFTCDGCAMVQTCAVAYDLYNTNGDCLWEK